MGSGKTMEDKNGERSLKRLNLGVRAEVEIRRGGLC